MKTVVSTAVLVVLWGIAILSAWTLLEPVWTIGGWQQLAVAFAATIEMVMVTSIAMLLIIILRSKKQKQGGVVE